ncbi:MAG: Ycf51 family protein [Cyanobacteria bacterium P01_A01_bin.84]
MFSQASFLQYAQWSGIATLAFAVLTILGFTIKWGIRFRLVGTTGFMIVLTAGLFTLSLTPLTRTAIPGAVKYSLVYDNGGTKTVIAISPEITTEQLNATLTQAANDLFSYGRLASNGESQLTVRARTIIHPEEGLSLPLYLGSAKRSLASRENSQIQIDINRDNLEKLPSSVAVET